MGRRATQRRLAVRACGKLLAETGKLLIDTPIAPSIVVQSYLAAGLIKLVGFSHIALRLLTLCVCGLGLVFIERTLYRLRVPRLWTLVACALLVLNPIAMHVGISFMSESRPPASTPATS